MIKAAVHALGSGPLSEPSLQQNIRPLFSRALARDEIYLANHSLGRPLDRTSQDVQEALDSWYRDLNGAWEPWIEAITAYRKAIDIAPTFALAHINLGSAFAGQNKLAEAEAAFRTAVDLDPKSAAARINLGSVLAIQNKLQPKIADVCGACPCASCSI